MAYILQEYYDTGDDIITVVYATNWRGQTFTDVDGFDLTRVSIKACRVGSPGDVTMDIMATTAGKPSGAILGTVDVNANGWTTDAGGDWYNFDFETPVTIPAATMCAIVLSIPAGNAANHIWWRDDQSGTTYTGGTYVYSSNSGSTWTISSGGDLMFRTYSTGIDYEDLAGTASGTLTSVGVLALSVALVGVSTGILTVTGALLGTISLAGTATGTLSTSAVLIYGPLKGSNEEKFVRRLVACANDSLYYGDV